MNTKILLAILLLAAPAAAQPADVIIPPSGSAFEVKVQTGDPAGSYSSDTASVGVYRVDTMVEVDCIPAGNDVEVIATVVVNRGDVAPNGLDVIARAWSQTGCGGLFVDSLNGGTLRLGNPKRPWLTMLIREPTAG